MIFFFLKKKVLKLFFFFFSSRRRHTRWPRDWSSDVCSSDLFARQHFGEDGKWREDGERWLPAETIFVAAGTQPNTVLAREDAVHFALDGKYFRACDEDGHPVKPQPAAAKPERAEVLLSRTADGRFVSFFGDLHPSYFGNIVKAPAAARRFQPGQFYRLQSYETLAPLAAGTRMQMEGLALTGAWVDREQGLVSTIVLEMGGSSDLCALLRPGEPVVLMGPTGTPTHIAPRETVLLAGGGLGNAVLFSIGQAFRALGSRVLYFAGYKKIVDRYKIEEIEAAADVVVWCCDEAPGFEPTRPQDRAFVGNIVQAMEAYGSGRLGVQPLATRDADRIIAIGSDRMMAAVARARHAVLAPYLKPHHFAIGSINSPMQCMLKEICAQCLQPQRDPRTGKTGYVFSCFNQDQPLDCVDFHALSERLRQNTLQEKLTAQWLAHCKTEFEGHRTLV